MVCKQPVNIKRETAQECSQNCSFKFDYNNNTSFTGKILRSKIELYVDKNDDEDKVIVNNEKLGSPVKIEIVTKSIHLYNGNHADAEIIITHINGGKETVICVPIKKDNSSSSSSNRFFNQILPNLSSVNNEIANINTQNLSLNDIVPTGEFFYYTCNNSRVIVFHKDIKPATIDSNAFTILQNLIKQKIDFTKDSKFENLYDKNKYSSFLEKISDPLHYSKVIVYRNGPTNEKEGFISKIKTTLGFKNIKEGNTGMTPQGAIGPDQSSKDYVYTNCTYKGTVKNKTLEKASNDKLESIRWFAVVIFILLLAVLIAILVFFYVSRKRNTEDFVNAGESPIDTTS